MTLPYPLTIKNIEFGTRPVLRPKALFGGNCGDFVAVRPLNLGDENKDKTFLGVLLGDLSTGPVVEWKAQEGVLVVSNGGGNPLIFIPELKAVTHGYASWWGRIEDETQLRQITDADIQNVWYVQALKALGEATPEG